MTIFWSYYWVGYKALLLINLNSFLGFIITFFYYKLEFMY